MSVDDITGSGEATEEGSELIAEFSTGGVDVEEFEEFPEYFDFDCDGEITIADAQIHFDVYVEEDGELPEGCEGPA